MPKTIAEERLRWITPVLNEEMKLVDIAKICPHSERSLKRWKASYLKYGIKGLEPKSTRPHTQPNETSIRIKEEVISLRKKTKLCAQKLHWRLEKEGLVVPVSTIGKIIKKEGLVRKYRVKKLKYKYIKVPLSAGELVEIDVKYVPRKLDSKRYYQFTAIDCSSRWRYLKVYDEQNNTNAIKFLEELIKIAPFKIKSVKTDNGAIFTNRYNGYLKSSDIYSPRLHPFDMFCSENNIIHYLIDPGKPAQNGKVERSHRSDQETFYDRNIFKDFRDLKRKIRIWNEEYNNLEHCSLGGKSPNEMLKFN